MSEPVTPEPRPRYTGGRIAMIVIGVILLLPGLCSVLFMLTMVPEIRSGDPHVGGFAGIWGVTFCLAAAGIWLIHVARKHVRAAAMSNPELDGNPKP